MTTSTKTDTSKCRGECEREGVCKAFAQIMLCSGRNSATTTCFDHVICTGVFEVGQSAIVPQHLVLVMYRQRRVVADGALTDGTMAD